MLIQVAEGHFIDPAEIAEMFITQFAVDDHRIAIRFKSGGQLTFQPDKDGELMKRLLSFHEVCFQ